MFGVALIVLIALALHAVAISNYGYFGDELYMLACAEHLDWGYVDHPPLAVWLVAVVRATLGDSLPAIRAVPVLAGAATIWLTGSMAREMGGGGFAASLAAGAVLISGTHAALASIYTLNVLDLLWWAVAELLLIRLINRERRGLWLALGAVMGLGLLTKWSMLWFGLGLGIAILSTPERRWLASSGPLLIGSGPGLAAALAMILGLPYVLWQFQHDWITWEWMMHGSGAALRDASALTFLVNQIVVINPINAPLWIGGLGCLLFAPFLRRWRLLGIQAAAILILLAWMAPAILHYPGPIFAVLLAAGAVATERFTQGKLARRTLRPAVAALMLLAGLIALPLAMPILPAEDLETFAKEVDFTSPEAYGRPSHHFPSQFGNMLGWPEIVAATARAWESIPEAERSGVAILAASYSDAGAVDLLGKSYGLPRALSAHNSYWLWGMRDYDLARGIGVGFPSGSLNPLWQDVETLETVHCPRCEPWRQEIEIVSFRRPRKPRPELWSALRND